MHSFDLELTGCQGNRRGNQVNVLLHCFPTLQHNLMLSNENSVLISFIKMKVVQTVAVILMASYVGTKY